MRQWREVQIADSCCGCGSVLTDLTNNEVWDGDEARCDCCGRPGSVSADEDGAHVNWHDVPDCKCWWCQAQNEIEAKDATIADLRRQVEELKSVIAQHDLCHNLHGKVDARAFADGCSAEQRKFYGCAPDADAVATLTKQLAEALKYGAPVAGTKAAAWVKSPCTKHDQYWTTISGRCMACRADDAEKQLAEANNLAEKNAEDCAVLREQLAEARGVIEGLHSFTNDNGSATKVQVSGVWLVYPDWARGSPPHPLWGSRHATVHEAIAALAAQEPRT